VLTDVKIWLETTGMRAEEEQYIKPPPLPYLIFTEDRNNFGADNKNCIVDRNISIELYSEKINHTAELKVESLLNKSSISYKKSRTWVDSERYYQTVYDFNFVEKY
jgi:hypothetical protein